MKKVLFSIFTLSLAFSSQLTSVNAEVFRDEWQAMDGNTSDYQVYPFTGFGRSSMLVDENDNPHLAWTYVEPYGLTYYIYYLYWDGTDWVDEDGNTGDPVADPTFGVVTQSDDEYYYYIKLLALNGDIHLFSTTSTGTVVHLTRDITTPFSAQAPIDDTYFSGGRLSDWSLQIDPNGVLHHLSYNFLSGYSYVNDRTGDWSDNLFNIDSELSLITLVCRSMKLDSSGNPHFICSGFEGMDEAVYFITDQDASLDGENFAVETVYTTSENAITFPALSFDTDDNPKAAWVEGSWTEDYNLINYLAKTSTWDVSAVEEVYLRDVYFDAIEFLLLEYGSDDHANIAWIQTRDSGELIYDADVMFAHNDNDGDAFSYEIVKEDAFDRVTGDPEDLTRLLHLDKDHNGGPFVAWSEHFEMGDSIYLARQLSDEDQEENDPDPDPIIDELPETSILGDKGAFVSGGAFLLMSLGFFVILLKRKYVIFRL